MKEGRKRIKMLRAMKAPFLAMLMAFTCGFFIPLQDDDDERKKLLAAHVTSIIRFFSFVILWTVTMLPTVHVPNAERLVRAKGSLVFGSVTGHMLYFLLRWNIWLVTTIVCDVFIFFCWVNLMTTLAVRSREGQKARDDVE